MKLYAGLAAVLVVVGTSGADAQSLKDKQYFADQEQYLAKEEVAPTNQTCGTNIAVKLDWSAPPSEADRKTYSAYGYCGAALEAMRRVCDSGKAGKDAVQQKIKSVTCGFGPQRAITMKDGAIDYKINFNSSNDADFVYEYLQNNL